MTDKTLVERWRRASREVHPFAIPLVKIGDEMRDRIEALDRELVGELKLREVIEQLEEENERIEALESERDHWRDASAEQQELRYKTVGKNMRKMAELRAENERLRALIKAHNKRCETEVGFEDPLTYRIELAPPKED